MLCAKHFDAFRGLKPTLAVALLAQILHADPSQAGAEARLCIHNGTEQLLLLVAESGSKRIVAETGPGDALCLDGLGRQADGVVGVFENAEALEGCSRLAKAGHTERLEAFARFDNCSWTTGGPGN